MAVANGVIACKCLFSARRVTKLKTPRVGPKNIEVSVFFYKIRDFCSALIFMFDIILKKIDFSFALAAPRFVIIEDLLATVLV